MKKKIIKHKYLLHLYGRVNEYLGSEEKDRSDYVFPDVVVSFCIVVEKIFKLKLHKKNPFLIFEQTDIKTNDLLSIIALGKEKDFETSKIQNIAHRFKIVFKKIFTDEEMEVLLDIFKVRNSFIHSYKSDELIEYNEEDIIKKMGTLWGKISSIAKTVLGKESIKNTEPKKKYSEHELRSVLIEEVREKIKTYEKINPYMYMGFEEVPAYPIGWETADNQCPRCHLHTFSLKPLSSFSDLYAYGLTDSTFTFQNITHNPARLYTCKKCGLELTVREYEIARDINAGSL